jgi:hypothetical protein
MNGRFLARKDPSNADANAKPVPWQYRTMIHINEPYRLKLLTQLILTIHILLLTACETSTESAKDQVEINILAKETARPQSEPLQYPATPIVTTNSDAIPLGAYKIFYYGKRVVILANQAYELDILSDLASHAGFEIIDEGTLWQFVPLNIDAADLHSALGELLHMHTYQLVYRFDKELQADALKQVIVGQPPEGREILEQNEPPNLAAMKENSYFANEPVDTVEELSEEDQIYLTQLMDPSPNVRAEAASNIEAAGYVLDYLKTVIITDPSPEVRAAAASSLEDSEDPRAVEALIAALGDNDPMVLIEVISSLEYVGDSRAIPHLQSLLNHPDEDVRQAVESGIQGIEWQAEGTPSRPSD